ncbi:hypothetical protein HYU06_05455 [Candidatus Woesearchaeota archaeon]|nr:hypothetical protein [Candidatus Woesearchaeota archaeon]
MIAIAFLTLNSYQATTISTANSSLANITAWDDTDTIKLFNSNTTWFYVN